MAGTPEIHHEWAPDGTTMSQMGTHKKSLRHGGSPSGTYPWPLMLIAAPAAVAIWSGWVGLGGMSGFGPVNLLPGVAGGFVINTAITLPVGIESYGAYALYAWLGSKNASDKTRDFARKSAIGALVLGCLGQVAYHLLAHAHLDEAPWLVVVGVACLPVLTLYFAATLTHLILADRRAASTEVAVYTPEPVLVEAPVSVPVVTSPGPDVESTPPPVEVTPEPVLVEPAAVTTEPATPSAPEVTTDPEPEVSTTAKPKRRRLVPATASDDQLADLILEHCDDPAALNPYRVNKILKAQCADKKVGDPRAAKLVDLAQRKHRARTVVAIGERR